MFRAPFPRQELERYVVYIGLTTKFDMSPVVKALPVSILVRNIGDGLYMSFAEKSTYVRLCIYFCPVARSV